MKTTIKRFTSILLAISLLLPIGIMALTAQAAKAPAQGVIGFTADEPKKVTQQPSQVIEFDQSQATTGARYTVLVLDIEREINMNWQGEVIYTIRSALDEVKQAAIAFVNQLMTDSRTNYVAVVTYSNSASIHSNFTTNLSTLKTSINNIGIGDYYADINGALELSDTLLTGVSDAIATKNVVLFTQGMATAGDYTYSGPYSEIDTGEWTTGYTGAELYAHGNSVHNTAAVIKAKYNIYTIGLFNSLVDVPAAGLQVANFFRKVAKDIQNAGFYDIDDPSNLAFVFGEVAGNILTDKWVWSWSGLKNAAVHSTINFSDYLFNDSATTYNPDLSFAAMALSWAAYDKSYLESAMKNELGFTRYQYFDKDGIDFALAQKVITCEGQRYTLIAVIVRGTTGNLWDEEWRSNLFDSGMIDGRSGFDDAADKVMTEISDFVGDTGNNYTQKFFVTGHSRGAAVANIVGERLSTENAEQKYIYTFATPNSVDEKERKSYDNIFNIVNPLDAVTAVPPGRTKHGITLGIDYNKNVSLVLSNIKSMYGFDANEACVSGRSSDIFYNHNQDIYMGWLKTIPASEINGIPVASHYVIVRIACPVDVQVTDANGAMFAQVVNNTAVEALSGSSATFVDVDKKYFILPTGITFKVNISATDSGTMDYDVLQYKTDGSVYAQTRKKDIALREGKTFSSDLSPETVDNGVKLYVLDDNGTPIATVQDNGKEVKFIKLWGKVTNYASNFINWLLCIVFFGWIWMA